MADDAPPAELRDHLALALVPGLGPKRTAALLQHFGSASAACRASAHAIAEVESVGTKLASRFAESLRSVNVDAEWKLIRRFGVRVVRIGTPEYPTTLATIPDPPSLIYVRGTLPADEPRAVALVGSRRCTTYGLRTAERIASGLARAGWVVVSGLARGIDGAAHKGSLTAGGKTFAVLAGGLSNIYPPEHGELAEQIVENGALITETPMTVAPQPGMFPARNRIISGLSRGVVVIEAGLRSGALITIDHAAEQGREAFAVPGNVDSDASAGCLDLIRKGARLVRSVDDILEDLEGLAPLVPPPVPKSKAKPVAEPTLFDAPKPAPVAPSGPPPGLDDVQQRIWDALASPKLADELAREVELPAGELSVVLMKLEMKKAIRRLAGNRYERRT